jgi:hypothetical protein
LQLNIYATNLTSEMVLFDPPTSTLAPAPTPTVALPVAHTLFLSL